MFLFYASGEGSLQVTDLLMVLLSSCNCSLCSPVSQAPVWIVPFSLRPSGPNCCLKFQSHLTSHWQLYISYTDTFLWWATIWQRLGEKICTFTKKNKITSAKKSLTVLAFKRTISLIIIIQMNKVPTSHCVSAQNNAWKVLPWPRCFAFLPAFPARHTFPGWYPRSFSDWHGCHCKWPCSTPARCVGNQSTQPCQRNPLRSLSLYRGHPPHTYKWRSLYSRAKRRGGGPQKCHEQKM